jgi:hypothetical protein
LEHGVFDHDEAAVLGRLADSLGVHARAPDARLARPVFQSDRSPATEMSELALTTSPLSRSNMG